MSVVEYQSALTNSSKYRNSYFDSCTFGVKTENN